MKFTGFWKLMQSGNNLSHYGGTYCLHLLPCNIKIFYKKSLHFTHSIIWPILTHPKVTSFRSNYCFHSFFLHHLSSFCYNCISLSPSAMFLSHLFYLSAVSPFLIPFFSISFIPLIIFFTIQTTKYYRPCTGPNYLF